MIAFVAIALLLDGPEDKGLAPVGAGETAAPVDPGMEKTEVNIHRKGVIYYSIGLFGLVAWSIPSIMAVTIGDYVGPKKSGAAIVLSGFLRKPQLTGSTGNKISGNSRAGLSALFPG